MLGAKTRDSYLPKTVHLSSFSVETRLIASLHLWFQMSKLEDRQGAYHGSVSIDAIQEMAVSKAPVPENLRQERSSQSQKQLVGI